MPKRPRSHQLEDISRNRLHRVFEEAGWTVEDLAKDYGEDLLVRIFDNGTATPLSFFVQAKATDNISRYRERNSDQFLYPLAVDHLTHWEAFQEPVILTLWDAQNEKTYWACVQKAVEKLPQPHDRLKRKTIRIPIPSKNVLDQRGVKRIRQIAQGRYDRAEREASGAEALLDFLEERMKVGIEYSSHGVAIVEGKQAPEVILFGKTLEALQEIATRRGISSQAAFDMVINDGLTKLEQHEATGRYPVLNETTGEIEYREMSDEELKAHIEEYLDRHSG